MGIFDFLSGTDEAQQAAAQNRAALNTYGVDANNIYGQYGERSLGALGGARVDALDALKGGLQNTIDAYKTGLTGALDAGQAGVGAYDPLKGAVDAYNPAIQAYYGSLGVGGEDARKAALDAYTRSPGFESSLDLANKQAANAASRLGNVGSGNTLAALGQRNYNAALNDYGGWQNRLQQFVPLQQQGYATLGAGLQGANKTLADIYSQGYGAIGGAYGTNAAQQAGIQTGYGQDVAGVLGNQYAGQAQVGKDITSGNIAANNQVLQAAQQDAANYWGALGAGVKALGGAFGGRAA